MTHYDEVAALLDATGFTVHKGHVPDSPELPYAVLWWPGVGRRSRNTLAGSSGRLDVSFRITSIGLTDVAVRIVAEAMQNAVLDAYLTVDGWVTHQILHRGTDVPIQEDRAVTDTASGRHPLYTVDAYRLAAEREQ
ncbi:MULTISPECIES: hypothetical protein [Prauserella salsuginis group]|uniref:Tail terminator n=2 Tax=Prauserella salsuginis group TaxID=2893672 RepID=A0A839XW65_9PSEU|nr:MULTISPECIES: hypothetical protein [Prauserella salsuginis group]MBB3666399.1 hypothetical protein [Prauserella sediminis]MCR3719137.1 hypothetical protein [Prauserella flava]MCR3735850.1 hypothetical protein [Prauserella salsuginis]